MASGNNNISVRIGTPATLILTLVFVVLKMTGEIDWHWIWVLGPLWIPMGLGVLAFLMILLLMVLGFHN